jgi:uncharacterized coiled-coil protein SlyX
MNPLTQSKRITILPLLIALMLGCFGLSPQARAVCQEGCLTNQNTVLGDDALLNNTGSFNTAIGFQALYSNTTGDGNTATGNGALFSNTTGNGNTANGVSALSSNTEGSANTANGGSALLSNTTGDFNTANGRFALFSNTTGDGNTATGVSALQSNTTGNSNTATGSDALFSNTTGFGNTANGPSALLNNTTGFGNTANGPGALLNNTTGNNNTADGLAALAGNTTGSSNIALGIAAGNALTTGSNNIDIGNIGVAAEANAIRIGTQGTQTTTFIAGISGTALGGGVAVRVNANGQLGTVGSAARFKQNIKAMDKASEAIHALKPVTFRYRDELDPEGIPQFGLVAEQVEKVNPDLVVRDKEGKPYTVRYDAVNAMLLNEFLKEHRKVQEQEATIADLRSAMARQRKDFETTKAQQQKQLQTLTAGLKEQAAQIQRVSDHVELSKSASQIVVNSQ